MPNTENNSQEEKVETKLAYWLDTFEGHVNHIPDSQQLIHDSIVEMNEQCFSKEQKEVVGTFLNNALSLSFLVKNYKKDIEKFISYHTTTTFEKQ